MSQRDFLTPLCPHDPRITNISSEGQKSPVPASPHPEPAWGQWGFGAPLPKSWEFPSASFNYPQLLLRLGLPKNTT